MTLVRAAPGVQLAVGRLRVDAAKAIAKLREYQLVDRTAWVLEAIRAAVASGATRITLAGDANDVWLSWEGPAWPADALPRLFDELVSPEPTSERHHLRLLAAAVNSALGMNPAYVDVFAIAADGAVRARYTPDVLDDPGELGDDSALRAVAAVPATPPAGLAPNLGMLVHLRRRAALGMLTHLFWVREPPELGIARAACRDLAVPLHIGSEVYCRTNRRDDLERVPLGDDLDGFVALVDPDGRRSPEHSALMEVAERGVVLATYGIELGTTAARAPVPLRLFIDATRMPTNASRSQVRREAHPIAAAEQRAPALAKQLVAQLVKVAGDGDERTRRVALALLAAELAGSDWNERASWSVLDLKELAKVPLVRDATGARVAIVRGWRGLVYTGVRPLPQELAPWLHDVLWIPPGDPTARIVAGAAFDARAARRYIRWARKQQRAHRSFFAHAPRAARVVAAAEPPRMRVELGAALADSCVPAALFADLSGEICVYAHRTTAELALLLSGREIERVSPLTTIGYEAVIDSAQLTPRDRFRGVVRDAEYHSVEAAVCGALVRAVEAIALQLANARLPDGFTAETTAPADVDARIVRDGIALALEAKLPIAGPLAAAPVWRTTGDKYASLDELRRQSVIGLVAGGTKSIAPDRRLAIEAVSPQLLAKLLPDTHVVQYDLYRSSGVDPKLFASRLASANRHALEIREPELCGAIAPAPASTLQLCHVGVELDTRPYTPKLVAGCKIVVDSDAIVPDAEWKTALDDGGLAARSFYEWELQLVRAAARALAGTAPPELHGSSSHDFDGDLGRTLCHALRLGGAETLLGAELVAALRARARVRTLGGNLTTIDELAAAFPGRIPYVDHGELAVPGYQPMLADALTAAAIASLVGCEVTNASDEVAQRRRAIERKQRLDAHRLLPVQALELRTTLPWLPLDPQLDSLRPRGVVGVGHDRLDIEVRIEGRLFERIVRPDEIPLSAIVELELHHTTPTLQGLQPVVIEQLVAAIGRTAPALLVHIARTQPRLLGELGLARSLLVAWCRREYLDRDTRAALADAPAFVTVRGDRVSITTASQPHGAIEIATWQGDWLAPDASEPVSAFDREIVAVPAEPGELHAILDKLGNVPLVDVTADITKLQHRRRMARGLIPRPTLQHVHAEVKRKLADLGDPGKRLGVGEIGLVDGVVSTGLLHEHGRLRQNVPLDVMPAIHLAVEAPELVTGDAPVVVDSGDSIANQLRALRDPGFGSAADASPHPASSEVQEVARLLVRAVLETIPTGALPVGIRRSLARAVLANRIAPADLLGAPVLLTQDGEWVAWTKLEQQIARYGAAWVLATTTADRPLDDDRIVFVLASADVALATGRLALVDARADLVLDAQARRNRARPPATALELPADADILAEVELEGDGTSTPRGVIGVLSPAAAARRGLHAHRAMHRFDLVDDPCDWPTVAVIDDARLEPDRTWARPILVGDAWRDLKVRILTASERVLAQLVERPDDALAMERIGSFAHSAVATLRHATIQIRGALWLVGAPCSRQGAAIRVVEIAGAGRYVPPHDLGMGGALFVFAPTGWNREVVLADICEYAHGLLVKAVAASRDDDPALVQAHVAHALALSRVQPANVPKLKFDCFRPAPLDSVSITAVLRGSGPQQVVGIGDDPDLAGIVDDDTPLSRVVIAAVGARARRGRQVQPTPAQPPPPVSAMPGAPETPREPPPAPVPPKPRPPHPIQHVVDAVRERLVDLGVPFGPWRIVDLEQPIVRHRGDLQFAGRSTELHAIANALRANSPFAPLAIDALVAHTVTVLDDALTSINEATQLRVLERLLLG